MNLPGCDVLVIGAGPAGSTAAYACARRGLSVVMVDHGERRRDKVCGCCVSADALQQLHAAGLGDAVTSASRNRLRSISLHALGRHTSLGLKGGMAISRRTLDSRLMEAAEASGVEVHFRTAAAVQPDRTVHLRLSGTQHSRQPPCVIVADGLRGRSLGSVGKHRCDPIVKRNTLFTRTRDGTTSAHG